MTDEEFLQKYKELLDKDYCNCNEMNCIDNNVPRRILNIAKELKEQLEQKNKIIEEAKKWVTNYKLKWDFDDETGLELNELLDILNKGEDE